VLSAARNTAKAIHPQIKDGDTLIVLKDEERVGKGTFQDYNCGNGTVFEVSIKVKKETLAERRRRMRDTCTNSEDVDVDKTRVFSVPVSVAAERSDPEHKLCPAVVRRTTAWLMKHGLDTQGLFRVPGSKEIIERYQRHFDHGDINCDIPATESVPNVAGVLTTYLLDLDRSRDPDMDMYSSPVITDKEFIKMCSKLGRACKKGLPKEIIVSKCQELLVKLKPVSAEIIRQVVVVCKEASRPEHTATNLMSENMLCFCTFPQIMTFMEQLVACYDDIFPIEYKAEDAAALQGPYDGVRIPPDWESFRPTLDGTTSCPLPPPRATTAPTAPSTTPSTAPSPPAATAPSSSAEGPPESAGEVQRDSHRLESQGNAKLSSLSLEVAATSEGVRTFSFSHGHESDDETAPAEAPKAADTTDKAADA